MHQAFDCVQSPDSALSPICALHPDFVLSFSLYAEP